MSASPASRVLQSPEAAARSAARNAERKLAIQQLQLAQSQMQALLQHQANQILQVTNAIAVRDAADLAREERARDRLDAVQRQIHERIDRIESRVAGTAASKSLDRFSVLPSTKEIESMQGDLQPARITKFIDVIKESMRPRYPEIVVICETTDEEYDVILKSATPEARAEMAAANAFLGKVVWSCILKDTQHGKLFRSQTLSEDPTALSDGRRILERLRGYRVSGGGAAHGQAKKLFAKEPFFNAKQSEDEAKIAADFLIDSYALLPGSEHDTYGVLRALLEKAPSNITTTVKFLQSQLHQSELLKKPAPWSPQQLGNLIAFAIGEENPGLVLSETKSFKSDQKPHLCANCGSANHHVRDCDAVSKCGLVSCPCVRGEVCFVQRKEPVPAKVPNFFTKTNPQKVQPDYIRDRVVQAHAKWNAAQRGSARGVHAAEEAEEAECDHITLGGELAYPAEWDNM